MSCLLSPERTKLARGENVVRAIFAEPPVRIGYPGCLGCASEIQTTMLRWRSVPHTSLQHTRVPHLLRPEKPRAVPAAPSQRRSRRHPVLASAVRAALGGAVVGNQVSPHVLSPADLSPYGLTCSSRVVALAALQTTTAAIPFAAYLASTIHLPTRLPAGRCRQSTPKLLT